MAAISAGIDAIPIPGLGCAIDTACIAVTLEFYQVEFGLGKATPEENRLLNKRYREVVNRYQVTSVVELLKSVVTKESSYYLKWKKFPSLSQSELQRELNLPPGRGFQVFKTVLKMTLRPNSWIGDYMEYII